MKIKIIGISSLIVTLLIAGGCSPGGRDGEYSRTEPVMGTFMQIKLMDPELKPAEARRILDKAMDLAGSLEAKFTMYDPKSEVNVLNINKTIKGSKDLYSVISMAKKVSRITGGEFDITVAPIMKANGLYKNVPKEILEKIPDGDGGVGWRNVTLKADGSGIGLRKGAWVDLSGIAKGYIVDRVYALLKSEGVDGVMVNAGGDIYCGVKPGGNSWRIGVRDPGSKDIAMTIDVKECSVATSGDYENVVIDKNTGKTISHIIDPLKEAPLGEAPSSITVIASSTAKADAFATGMMAMGAKKAIALANFMPDVHIIAIDNAGGDRVITYSKGAEKYISGEKK